MHNFTANTTSALQSAQYRCTTALSKQGLGLTISLFWGGGGGEGSWMVTQVHLERY